MKEQIGILVDEVCAVHGERTFIYVDAYGVERIESVCSGCAVTQPRERCFQPGTEMMQESSMSVASFVQRALHNTGRVEREDGCMPVLRMGETFLVSYGWGFPGSHEPVALVIRRAEDWHFAIPAWLENNFDLQQAGQIVWLPGRIHELMRRMMRSPQPSQAMPHLIAALSAAAGGAGYWTQLDLLCPPQEVTGAAASQVEQISNVTGIYDASGNSLSAACLYETLSSVFALPTLAQVRQGAPALREFYAQWDAGSAYGAGPEIYQSPCDSSWLIMTATSQRQIRLQFSPGGLATCEVTFPRPSRFAAGEIIGRLRQQGVEGGQVVADSIVYTVETYPGLVHPHLGRMAWDREALRKEKE
jgi:hypothetical protein